MEFSQKGRAYINPLNVKTFRTTFEFAEDGLTYTFNNSAAKTGGTIPYHKIPLRKSAKEFRVWGTKYFWLFCATPCLLIVIQFLSAGQTRLALYALAAFAAWSAFAAILHKCSKPLILTTLSADPPIHLLNDRQYDVIMEEMNSRRQRQLRSKLAQVDFNRPYFEELRKMRWLWDEKLISDEEWQQARQKIAIIREKPVKPPEHSKLN